MICGTPQYDLTYVGVIFCRTTASTTVMQDLNDVFLKQNIPHEMASDKNVLIISLNKVKIVMGIVSQIGLFVFSVVDNRLKL